MKMQRKYNILAVDDDEVNLMILAKCVEDAGYTVRAFESANDAWEYLQNNPHEIDIALLDKMMPDLSGLEMVKRIRNSPSLRHIMVIMQTGDAGLLQMREGLESGVYYYLTKPFHPDILTSILHSVANECAMRAELLAQKAEGQTRFIGLMEEGDFIFKTHQEAVVLAAAISQAAVYPEFVSVGLMELFSNAIEHGNLEIGFQKKSQCLLANSWKEELAIRAANTEYGKRSVHVHLEKIPAGLHLTVRDEGKGFDWGHYLYDDHPTGGTNELNGRGIGKAIIMLDELRYADKGNEAHCDIYLDASVHGNTDAAAPLQQSRGGA